MPPISYLSISDEIMKCVIHFFHLPLGYKLIRFYTFQTPLEATLDLISLFRLNLFCLSLNRRLADYMQFQIHYGNNAELQSAL